MNATLENMRRISVFIIVCSLLTIGYNFLKLIV